MSGLPSNVYPDLQRVLGRSLEVRGFTLSGPEGELIRDHLKQLSRFSPRLLRKLLLAGLSRIEIGPGSVAHFSGYEHLANTQAPGHRDGITLSDIAGAYDSGPKRVILGTQGIRVDGLVPHEMGHAMGDLLGFYQDRNLQTGYLKNAKAGTLERFYLDAGEPSRRGLEEFFADLVRSVILHGRVPRHFGPEIEAFVAEKLLKGL